MPCRFASILSHLTSSRIKEKEYSQSSSYGQTLASFLLVSSYLDKSLVYYICFLCRSCQTTKPNKETCYQKLLTLQVKGVLQEIVQQVVGSVAKSTAANKTLVKRGTSIPVFKAAAINDYDTR